MGAAAAFIVAVVLLFTHPLLPKTVGLLVSLATGTHASFADVRISADRLLATGILVRSRAGPPILRARRIELRYDLGAWRRRRYGLVAISADHPVFRLERLANGNWNIGRLSVGGGAPSAPARGVPFWFSTTIQDGTVQLRDASRPSSGARRLDIAHIDLDLRANQTITAASFTARAFLVDRGIAYPIRGAGSLSYARGEATQHWYARMLPVADLADFFIPSPTVQLSGGMASNLDATLFALGVQHGTPASYHLSGTVALTDVALDVSALMRPITGIHGQLLLFDSGLATRAAQAELAGTPITFHGGFYALTSGAPQLRLSVDGHTDLRDLRALFRFSQNQPVFGGAHLGVQILGSTADPLIVSRLAIPSAAYDSFRLHRIRGTVTYYRGAVTLDPLLVAYGPIDLAAGGTFGLGDHVHTSLEMSATVPTARMPYAAQLVPNAHLLGALHLDGTDLNLGGEAFLRGEDVSAGSTFAAVGYDADRLLISPLRIARPDGSELWGGAAIDQHDHRLAMWETANGALMRPLTHPVELPGLDIPELPPLDGRIDARLAMEGKLADLGVSGRIGAHAMHVGPLAISEGSALVAGSGSAIDVFDGRVRGPWGAARLRGGYDAAHTVLALRGPYRADLAGARPLLADAPAHGAAEGTLSVVVRPQRTLVQFSGRALGKDTVRGVPVSSGFATLGIDAHGADVYAGGAAVAGGTVAAAGRFAPDGVLDVAARDLRLAQLHAAGIPLNTGRVLLVGQAHPDQHGTLDFDGGLALVGSSVFGEDASGSARFDLAGDRVTIERGSGAYDGTWAAASGTVSGVSARTPRLDLAVNVRALDVAPWARRFGYGGLYAEGNAAARFRLSGTASDPRVDGVARMNVGSVHGMDFTDLAARFTAAPHMLTLRGGTIEVGGSALSFSGALADGAPRFAVSGHNIDLADFNDWFDRFDMLAGKGDVDVSAAGVGKNLSGHADVAIQGLRVRDLPFGEMYARLQARSNRASGTVDVGDSALGRLAVQGSANLPRGGAKTALAYLQRIDTHARGTLQAFDLTKWLPALGIDAPLAGKLDAKLALDGRYPRARMLGSAQLLHGVVGTLPIDRLALGLSTNFISSQLTGAELELPNVSASGSGTYGPAGRLALRVHVRSPNVRHLISETLKSDVDIDASGEADLRIGGTVERPDLSGGFDLLGGAFGHLPFREAFGELALRGRDLELRDGELHLSRGSISLAGRLPLQLSPMHLGPPGSALGLNLGIDDVELSDFTSFLPAKSVIGGRIDGKLALAGTLAAPQVAGALFLRGGTFAAPFEREPISGAEATTILSGHTIAVDHLHALVGGGSVDGGGRLVIAPAQGGAKLAYQANLVARHARLDIPALGRGSVDANLRLAAAAGQVPTLSGGVTLSDATLALSGLYDIATGAPAARGLGASAPAGLRLDLHAAVGRNVRVMGSVLDVGGTGSMDVTGTLAQPKLSALFEATNGTISYFDRLFRVDRASVSFDPQSGPIPFITATARTRITSVSPSVAVTLKATGAVDNLNIAFSSDPAYDRQQLLALLLDIPTLTGQGLTPGETAITPATQPGGTLPRLRGAPEIPSATLPPGVLVPTQSGGVALSGEALSILNAQFGRALLAPLSGALGFADLSLALEQGGSVAIDVRKGLSDRLALTYAQTFALPTRQSVGFDYFPSENTSLNFQYFQQGASSLQNQISSNTTSAHVVPGQPLVGTQGIALSIRRLFP